MNGLVYAGIITTLLLEITAGILFLRGWRKLQHTHNPYPQAVSYRTPQRRSLLLFFLSLIILAIALLPPFSQLSTQFFHLRVTRHLLLNALAPSLFFMSDPMPAFWHGIPQRWQQQLHTIAHRLQFLRPFINRGIALIVNIAASIMWFDPTLHQLALTHPAIRALEVALLVGGGAFLWYHITRATPQLTPALPTIPHIGYCALGAFPLKFIGLIFLFSESTLYSYPVPDLGWLSMTYAHSYRLGGAVIWLLGGVAYTYSAGYFMQGWFDIEENKPDPPRTIWENPESLRIPGFD